MKSLALAWVIAGVWLASRVLAPHHPVGLGVAVAAGVVAAALVSRTERRDRFLTGTVVPTISGGALAGLAIGAGWVVGGDGASNWALQHGLQLGWWTNLLPFLPGKPLAMAVTLCVVAVVVLPEELVTRGLLFEQGVGRSWSLRLQLVVQMLLTTAAHSALLWNPNLPNAVAIVQVLVSSALAAAATMARRRFGSLTAPILLHSAFQAVLVLHAFAWIPRLYR